MLAAPARSAFSRAMVEALDTALVFSRLAGGCDEDADDEDAVPEAGKKRFGGAHEGRWCSSALLDRIESAEKAAGLRPLVKKPSFSESRQGVPGMELPGVEKGELGA